MPTASPEGRRYGFIGIVVADRRSRGARINQILASHSDLIVGRLGMPNLHDGELAIITLIILGTPEEVSSLTGKLGALPGVSVKSGLHKEEVSQ